MTRSVPHTTNMDPHRSSLVLIPMPLVKIPLVVGLPGLAEVSIRSLMLQRVPRRIYLSNYLETTSLVVLAHVPIMQKGPILKPALAFHSWTRARVPRRRLR